MTIELIRLIISIPETYHSRFYTNLWLCLPKLGNSFMSYIKVKGCYIVVLTNTIYLMPCFLMSCLWNICMLFILWWIIGSEKELRIVLLRYDKLTQVIIVQWMFHVEVILSKFRFHLFVNHCRQELKYKVSKQFFFQ